MPSRAYSDLARYLVVHRRRDLLWPLADAVAALARLAILIDAAQRHADAVAATRLRAEAMRQRARFEHAVFNVVETISEEPDGADMVSALLGGDGERLLADVLLDGEG